MGFSPGAMTFSQMSKGVSGNVSVPGTSPGLSLTFPHKVTRDRLTLPVTRMRPSALESEEIGWLLCLMSSPSIRFQLQNAVQYKIRIRRTAEIICVSECLSEIANKCP